MSPDELRRLLDADPLEILDDEQQVALAAGLESDPALRAEADALDAAYTAWSARVDADDAPWSDDLQARVIGAALAAYETSAGEETPVKTKTKTAINPPPAVVQAVAEKIRLTCTYCHALAGREQLAYCAACLAPHHDDCFAEHGHCATPGCEETRLVRPHDVEPKPRQRKILPWLFGMASLAAGVAAFTLTATPDANNATEIARPYGQRWNPGSPPKSEPPAAATHLELNLVDVPLAEAVAELDRRIPEVTLSLRDEYEGIEPSEFAPEVGERRVSLTLPWVPWQDAVEALARVARARVEVDPETKNVALALPIRVTVQFTDATQTAVLEMIGAYRGLEVTVDENVRGDCTLDLKQVPWDEALIAVASIQQATVWRSSTGIRVALSDQAPLAGETPLVIPPSLEAGDSVRLADPPPTLLVDLPGGQMSAAEAAAALDLHLALEPDLAREQIELKAAPGLPWPEALRRLAEAAHARVQRRGREQTLTLTWLPRVTIQFTDANVRTVFQLLAAYSGKNLILSSHVAGTATMDLGEVDWDVGLVSLAAAMDLRAWQLGDVVLIVHATSPAPRGATPLRLEETWTGRPAEDMTVDLVPGTVAERCAQVALQTGARVECLVEGDRELIVTVARIPWRAALTEIARESGCWVEDVEGGALLRPSQPTTLRAFDAPAGIWLQLLGALSDRHLLLSPKVGGRVSVDLSNVSYQDAFEGSVRSLGLVPHFDRDRIVRVSRGDRPPTTQNRETKALDKLNLLGEWVYPPQLQGVQIDGEQSRAILDNTIYRLGGHLRDRFNDWETELKITQIEPTRVVLSEERWGLSLALEVRFDSEGRPSTACVVNQESRAEALANMIGSLHDDDDEWYMQAGAHRLLEAGESVVPALIAVVQTPGHAARGSAAWALAHNLIKRKRRPQAAIEALRSAVTCDDLRVRMIALAPFKSLLPEREHPTAAALRQTALEGDDTERLAAANALCDMIQTDD